MAALVLAPTPGQSGEVQVVGAKASCGGAGCSFSVTLLHEDTGWDHYADHWRVLTPDGDEIARRVLYHPHVDEQPFTRSLGGVDVPPGIEKVGTGRRESRGWAAGAAGGGGIRPEDAQLARRFSIAVILNNRAVNFFRPKLL